MYYDVFISYSRKDTLIVDKICAALDEQGITYFIDRKGIGGGMEFPAVLAEAILNSKIILFLGSKNSYQSRFTDSEVTFAFNEKPKGSIVPYIIDGSMLPTALKFTFSNINIRTLEEHPIKTILMMDLCHILGREYVGKEERILEEQIRFKEERQKKEEIQRSEEERLHKEEILRQQEQQKIKGKEPRKAAREVKKGQLKKNMDDFSGYVIILLPLFFLGLGIWAGVKYESFWLGTEIFLALGWLSFGASVGLSHWARGKVKEAHSDIAIGLMGIVIAVAIHSGIYISHHGGVD